MCKNKMIKKNIINAIKLSLLVVVIFLQGACSDKVSLVFEPNTPPEESSRINLNVYVENSGSMDAYMCAGSTLKDAVYDYVSSLSRNVDTCNFYYINSRLIEYSGDLDDYIKNLTPASFAKAGGKRTNTDLREIFKQILQNHTENTVSVFVSDCILDISHDAKNYFGNCQISVRNCFAKALLEYPHLAVEIAKMESTFDGNWYCGRNVKRFRDIKRPYYIWIIGNDAILAKLNKRVSIVESEFGFLEHCAFSTVKDLPFNINKKHYVVSGRDNIEIEVLADFSRTLQTEDVLTNTDNFIVKNPEYVSLTAVKKIALAESPYTHVIKMSINSPQTVRSEEINICYPAVPAWVELSNDDTGDNIDDNLDKTTGIKYLVNGVAKAYEDYPTHGNIVFKIENK